MHRCKTSHRVQSHISGECPEVAAHMWSTGYSVSSELKPVQYVLADGTVAAVTAWPGTLLGPEGTGACHLSAGPAHPAEDSAVRGPGPPVS